jgi:hypothetical protein
LTWCLPAQKNPLFIGSCRQGPSATTRPVRKRVGRAPTLFCSGFADDVAIIIQHFYLGYLSALADHESDTGSVGVGELKEIAGQGD